MSKPARGITGSATRSRSKRLTPVEVVAPDANGHLIRRPDEDETSWRRRWRSWQLEQQKLANKDAPPRVLKKDTASARQRAMQIIERAPGWQSIEGECFATRFRNGIYDDDI